MQHIFLGLLLTVTAVMLFTVMAFAGGFVPPPTEIPEPSTLHLLGTGVAALLGSAGIYNLFKK